MTKTTERDPLGVAIAEINGSCKPHILAGINGNLPHGWAARSIRAQATFRKPELAVFCSATSAGQVFDVGAKLEIDPPCDHLRLADELARQLCAKIRAVQRPRTVRIALDPDAIMPTRGSAGASGYDLYAPTDVMIRRGATVVIHSGVHVELPDDSWEAQIRPRSGMSKRGLVVSIGTVDSDYKGVVGATVVNLSQEDQTVKRGERFAQMVIARVEHPEIERIEVAELGTSERGDGSFGSTGR